MTTYYSSSSDFLAKKTPSVMKNHCKSTAPESHQTTKIGFLSSDGLVQIWLTPSRQCSHKTAALNSARPHRFLTTSKSHEALETTHSITMASSEMPFFVHMRRATLNFELKLVYCVRSKCHQVCCYKNEVNKCKERLKCMEM